MLQNNNSYKILKVFLDSPLHDFQLREISRLTKIAPPSVKKYLLDFEKKSLISKRLRKNYNFPIYRANRENEEFIFLKKISIILELNYSGLVDYLWETLSPKAVVLYGSYAKGESTEDSDIDLFILGNEKNLGLEKFENILNKKIHILFNNDFDKMNKEIKNNILNGIILKGYLKAFK